MFSELRTIYETTPEDPHTFRLSIKLKDLIDGDILSHAVNRTMKRYPYFTVRMRRKDADVYFENNPLPVPVLETDERITLGTAQTNYHLLAVCYHQNWLYMDCYHGLADGGGFHPMTITLLHQYLSEFYGIKLETEHVRLPESPVPDEEWEDPAKQVLSLEREGWVSKWSSPAFQIDHKLVHLQPESIVTTIHIPEKEFIPYSISNDGSPATIVSLLLARSLDMVYPDAADPIVIAMCVNQRKALKAPLAHQSLVGDVRLVYEERMKKMPFMDQGTCFRGMVSLQSDDGMVLDEIRDYQDLMRELSEMKTFEERHETCVRRMEDLSKCVTATVSYLGKVDMGPVEPYLQEFDPIPSTALPSMHTPLTIEMASLNGSISLNFIQYFPEMEYFSQFVKQLRDNNINYNVLWQGKALYPMMEMPEDRR